MSRDVNSPFDKMTDKIALTVTEFTLHKKSEPFFHRYAEPYIVSVAADARSGEQPAVQFNMMEFPRTRAGAPVSMLGHGHLVYGPEQPGEWAAVSVLIMESDSDIRRVGERMRDIVDSKATELSLKLIMAAQPGYGAIAGILKELTSLISAQLQRDKDDELFRTEGTFLRDDSVPYLINRSYNLGNDYASVRLAVLPLDVDNGQGSPITTLTLN